MVRVEETKTKKYFISVGELCDAFNIDEEILWISDETECDGDKVVGDLVFEVKE